MVSGSQVWDMEFSWQYFCTVVLRALMFGCKNFLCPSDRICMRVSVCEENRDWTLLRSKCNPMFYDWRATSSNRAIVSAIFHAKGVMSSTKRTSNKDSSALNRQADIPHCNTQLNKQGQHILGALRRGWKKDRCCTCCYFHLALPPIDWTISTAKFKREGPNCHDHKNKLLIYPKSQSWRPPMPKSFQLSWHGIGRRWQEQHGRTLETGGFSASFVLLPETFLHIGQITVKSYSSSGWRNRQCTATIRSRFLGILGYLHPNATSDHCKRGRGQLMNATMIQGFVSWFKPPRKTRYLHHACRITRWLATETSKINKIDE